jgi:hypothetical protein
MFTLVVPKPKDASEANAQAIRLERAQQIIVDGYGFEFDEVFPQCFIRKPGSRRIAYTVDAVNGGCDCLDMTKTGRPCKHYLAVWLLMEKAREEEDAATVAQYDAEQYEAEIDACLLSEDMRLCAQLYRDGIDY